MTILSYFEVLACWWKLLFSGLILVTHRANNFSFNLNKLTDDRCFLFRFKTLWSAHVSVVRNIVEDIGARLSIFLNRSVEPGKSWYLVAILFGRHSLCNFWYGLGHPILILH